MERVRDKSDIFTLLKIESIFLGADFVCLKILGNVHGFFLRKLHEIASLNVEFCKFSQEKVQRSFFLVQRNKTKNDEKFALKKSLVTIFRKNF